MPEGRLLRGSELAGVKLYKILKSNLTHFGFTYKEGLNELQEPFNPSGDCDPGGLYITEHPELWIMMGLYVASVILPDDAQVWKGSDKYKVDKLILGPIAQISDEIYLNAVQQNGMLLEHIPHGRRNDNLLIAAVREEGNSIKYVLVCHRSIELCFIAVEQNPRAIEFVPRCYFNDVEAFSAIVNYGLRFTDVLVENCSYPLDVYIAVVRRKPEAIKDVPSYYYAKVLSIINKHKR